MKKLLITFLILISIKLSAQENQTQDLIFDNGKFIYFKDATGTTDGVLFGRFSGNSLRMKYNLNPFIFDALDNFPVQFNNSSSQTKIQIHPSGNSYFNGGNVGIGLTSPSSLLHLYTTGNDALKLESTNPSGVVSFQLVNANRHWTIRSDGSDGSKFQIRDNTSNLTRFTIKSDGNVGIGTINPNAIFDVAGHAELDGSNPISMRISSLSGSSNWIPDAEVSGIDFHSSDGSGSGSGIRSSIKMISENAIGSRYGLKFMVDEGQSLNEAMRIESSGSVGIGTGSDGTGTHKLAVEGSIGAREIKVEATGWSDFVFSNDYNLPSLEEVEKYITENNHLPEIPSEAEVLEDGINLGEMNAKLLQKIEELTLYLIEQNKRIITLEEKLAEN
jgi:hypothetical protein